MAGQFYRKHGAKGTNVGGQFIGPKTIARELLHLVEGRKNHNEPNAPGNKSALAKMAGKAAKRPTANDLETAIFGNKHVEPSKVPTPAVDKAPDWVGHNITYDAHLVPLHGSNEHDHFNVKQAGKTIGSVHGGGPNGAPWSAYNPNGGKLGDSNTRDGAAALLVDHHKVNTPKAPAKPAAPGPKVTTQKQTTMIGKKYSAAVMVDGKKIGAVHQGYDGAWTAVKPLGTQKNGGVVGPLATRKAAVDAVVAMHAGNAPQVPAPKGSSKGFQFTAIPGAPTEQYEVHAGGEHLGSVRMVNEGIYKGTWAPHGPDGKTVVGGYEGGWSRLQAAQVLKVESTKAKKAAGIAEAKPNKVPGKPGVTWTLTEPKKLPGWSQPKQSQFIHQDGLFLGSVHQMEGSGWKADLPNGGHVDTSYKASKTDAINALIKARDDARANLAPQISVKPPPPGQKAESVLTPPKAGAKFELLADTGESGDGYAPGGEWGKYGASGILIQSTEGGQTRYLLVQRGPKVTNNQGKWQLPGGALNSKENAYQGAARETVEEVGAPPSHLASLKPVGEHVFENKKTGWQYTTIAASTTKTFTPKVDGTETADAKWFTAAEVEQMRADGQLVPKLDKAIGPIIGSYPSKPVKATAAEKMVRGGDFSKLRRVGMQAGSNEGGVFEAPDGSRWYVKAQKSAEHANNEAAASSFYRAAGIDAPEVIRGSGAPGLSGANHTATRMYSGAKSDLKAHVLGADKGIAADRSYMARVHEGFAMDAWLGNWDVAGASFDNILTVDGKPVRVDPGGALLFRAQGAAKGDAFGPTVPEWDTFTDKESTKPTAALFDSMTSHEMVASAEKVKAFTPAKIRAMVKANNLNPSLADTLIERRKNILARAKAEAAKPRKAFAEDALTNSPALAAVKVKNTGGKLEKQLVDEGVSSSDAYATAQALSSYKGSGYQTINGFLLDQPGMGKAAQESAAEQVRLMDIAFAHSVLPNDIVVYRGERNSSRNFPPGEWSLVGGMEGKEWTFRAYASTSVAKGSTAEAFATGHTTSKGAHGSTAQPTIMRIVVPKGTAAIGLDEPGSYEQEVLLNRHLRYRVVKDHGVKNGVRNLDVMVVGS